MAQMKDILRKLRAEREAKQSTVADDLMISRGTYSSYENGITPPTETCIKLAEYFDVSIDYLLGLSSERRPVGGKLIELFYDLDRTVGDIAPTATDISVLLESFVHYYRKGSPCGDTPIIALVGYINGLRTALVAAVNGDGPALIDGANAAAVAALEVTKMPAALYKTKGDTTP